MARVRRRSHSQRRSSSTRHLRSQNRSPSCRRRNRWRRSILRRTERNRQHAAVRTKKAASVNSTISSAGAARPRQRPSFERCAHLARCIILVVGRRKLGNRRCSCSCGATARAPWRFVRTSFMKLPPVTVSVITFTRALTAALLLELRLCVHGERGERNRARGGGRPRPPARTVGRLEPRILS